MAEPALETFRAVPFLDLWPMHEGLARPLLADIAALIDSGAFTNGPAVREFEDAFAHFCVAPHCIGVGSGLDALRLALVGLGLESGDRVLVPANTFIATFEAVTQAGGIPVPVDVTELDYNIDPAAAAAAVDARTRFILPVHLYGQLADMAALELVAERHELTILEDACQAHGARRDGRIAGSSGTAGAFSFYPGKNLGAMGDAGALVTHNTELRDTVRALREHGQIDKYRHQFEGWTSRLDTIQAIVLLRKLPHLNDWNRLRRAAASVYSAALSGLGDLQVPPVPAGSEPVWHLYVVRTQQRDELAEFLARRGIATGRHYPEPAHLTAAYASLGYARGNFPQSEALAEELLSLPIFPGITAEQLDRVIAAVAEFYAHGR